MQDLTSASTQDLVTELGSRGSSGLISLTPKGAARLDVWWGSRVKCLGLISRLTHGINCEMNEHELCEDDEDEEDTSELDEAPDALGQDFPQMGQYL